MGRYTGGRLGGRRNDQVRSTKYVYSLNILSSTTSLRSLLSSIRQFTSCCQLTPSDNFQRPESSAAVIQAAMPGIHYTAPKLGRRSKRSVTAQP
ncbi:hypothetical protein PC116_g18419 [Phytophthora cactorum]|uniref:Uncharacterized protein n=1 Tax=Phytophthora cactorum TaxID=29920 RepID=A0A8T1KDC0_9STRA|nr:hypothetical protein PC114_g17646 [Phytophthora cactorum]KAG2898477.1 hypothetical protein PC115_g16847 [Phytophthora cactorum]KAG2913565.1 hypothetical protein PC117_g18535 [Phytophthora cactorum]KAG4233358.1 hypothetical protein PC116_g18419 [Phytophthora cactorum]